MDLGRDAERAARSPCRRASGGRARARRRRRLVQRERGAVRPRDEPLDADGSMNIGRISFTGTLLRDGRVLVVGGNSTSGGLQASAELYDPATGRWTLTGSLRATRW